jgi:hypothetical protein
MTSSVPSTEHFLESFPIQAGKIVGQPTYATLTDLRDELKQNAAAVPSNRGGGAHGYLGIVMSASMYDTVAPGQPFIIVNYPGPQPNLANDTTAAQISESVRQHTEGLREWREYTNIHNALKKQLTDAIEPVYLRSQRHRHVGFANKSLREIIAFLFQAYGQLTPQKLIDNQMTMNTPWDPNTPFETLIEQIEDAMEIADAANQAFTDAQILTLAYTLVYNTGLYFDECKEWKAKPTADKTWENFKIFFLEAQTELRQQQQATSARAGFSAVAEDKENQIADALANLATAQAADQQAFCQLATTNTDLAAQLKAAMDDITSLKTLMLSQHQNRNNSYNDNNNNYNNNNNNNANPPNRRKPNTNYCWTHGFRVAENHTSQNCKNTKFGHQQTATKDNLMGGSTAGQQRN